MSYIQNNQLYARIMKIFLIFIAIIILIDLMLIAAFYFTAGNNYNTSFSPKVMIFAQKGLRYLCILAIVFALLSSIKLIHKLTISFISLSLLVFALSASFILQTPYPLSEIKLDNNASIMIAMVQPYNDGDLAIFTNNKMNRFYWDRHIERNVWNTYISNLSDIKLIPVELTDIFIVRNGTNNIDCFKYKNTTLSDCNINLSETDLAKRSKAIAKLISETK